MKRRLNYKTKKSKQAVDSKSLIKSQGPQGSVQVGKKWFYQDQKNYQLLNNILQKQSLEFPAEICVLCVYPDISKTVAGRCIKASNQLKFFSEFDYIIQLSGSLWDVLTDEQKYLLLYHELLHIQIDFDKDGNTKFLLKDHDVKDFRSIITKYGIDWIQNISTINSSIYDTDGDVSI